jgi:hypothetical protein
LVITARVPQSPYDRGYATRREQAMADFEGAVAAAIGPRQSPTGEPAGIRREI